MDPRAATTTHLLAHLLSSLAHLVAGMAQALVMEVDMGKVVTPHLALLLPEAADMDMGLHLGRHLHREDMDMDHRQVAPLSLLMVGVAVILVQVMVARGVETGNQSRSCFHQRNSIYMNRHLDHRQFLCSPLTY